MRITFTAFFLTLAVCLLSSCSKKEVNLNYPGNPQPLVKNAFVKLPLGAIRPEGWLKSQLEAQATGLTGNIDEFWSDLVNSSWRGGTGDAWERGPYYLDGLVPLAYLLEDQVLLGKVKSWIEPILASGNDSGWYGPASNNDRWPLAVSNKVLMQYYEATGDNRAIDVLKKYFKYLYSSPPDWPDKEWRGVRAMENAVTGYWLYRHTCEPWILRTIQSIHENSYDWTSYYEKFPWDSIALAEKKIPLNWGPEGLTAHVVNNAMAIKYPGLWYQQSGDERFKKAVLAGIEKYNINHGQTGGRFSGDEHLSGKSPDRGTELCAVVEYMFSLGELFTIFGDNTLADRLEMLAFNALPGTTTPDMWAHQYNQQSNQVLVSAAKRSWSTNGDYSNIYGLMPNYGCCLANMHQGWPKFTQNLWMATNDNGLAAVAYSPSTVKAKVGKGVEVTIREITDYPFKGDIKLIIGTEKPVRFPLYLRIPGWAEKSMVTSGNKTMHGKPGETLKLTETWKDGDIVTISLPLEIKAERRYNNAVSLLRGPLYLSLSIDKEYRSVKINYDNFSWKGSIDWEIYPLSPWNYALLVDENNLERGLDVLENDPGKYPFADMGEMVWSEDSGRYIVWDRDPALVITMRGMQVPGWKLRNNSADTPPLSPVKPEGTPEIIRLVPYGCTRLRITEFPVVDLGLIEDVMKPGNSDR